MSDYVLQAEIFVIMIPSLSTISYEKSFPEADKYSQT